MTETTPVPRDPGCTHPVDYRRTYPESDGRAVSRWRCLACHEWFWDDDPTVTAEVSGR